MANDKRRNTARVIVVLYLAIISTFELSRFDFLPLSSSLSFFPGNPRASSFNIVNGHHICPADLFAHSTTSAEISGRDIFFPETFSFVPPCEKPVILLSHSNSLTTRAPPQA